MVRSLYAYQNGSNLPLFGPLDFMLCVFVTSYGCSRPHEGAGGQGENPPRLGQKPENGKKVSGPYTSQVYADMLKEANHFSKEDQREALSLAVARTKKLLTADAKAFLESVYGDLNEYLQSRIEREVCNQKMGWAPWH